MLSYSFCPELNVMVERSSFGVYWDLCLVLLLWEDLFWNWEHMLGLFTLVNWSACVYLSTSVTAIINDVSLWYF